MAGGKGTIIGREVLRGKVGVDGSKKQQSHSSKAGLQVSIAQTRFRRFWTSAVLFLALFEPPSILDDVIHFRPTKSRHYDKQQR